MQKLYVFAIYPGFILIPIGKEKEREEIYFMNKYSKRALKTTATIGMSLAMVLSGVAAPAMTNIKAATLEDAITNKSKVKDLLDLLGDVKNIAAKDVVGGSGNIKPATSSDFTFEGILADTEFKAMLEDANKYASVVGFSEEQAAMLKHLVGTKIDDVTKTAVQFAADLVKTDGVLKELKEYKLPVSSADVELYDKVSALLNFKGNIDSTTTNDETLEKIEDIFADLEADVKDYKEDNVGSDAKKFAKKLADEKIVGQSVAELVDDEKEISYNSLSSVKAFIAKVTKDSFALDGVKYGDVKDEGVVKDYIEGLQTIADEMQEVKDLINDTKTEKKAFDKLNTKLQNLVDAIKEIDEDKREDAIDAAVKAFRASDIKALKAYVDTFVNEFWTVASEQRTSGSYRVKQIDAGLGRYNPFEAVAGAKLVDVMMTLVDSDKEETFYDLLIADAASTDELLKAVTTDIEGLTLSSNMTNKDAAKIIAARKALNKLGKKGDSIYDSLTRSEKADVDASRELVEALYFKLILNSNVTTVGWVDLGNGNWDYFNADGTKSTKWVAAGSDWYYVKDGKMLRNTWVAQDATGAKWYYVDNAGKMVSNTTIDGFVIDANGVWTK